MRLRDSSSGAGHPVLTDTLLGHFRDGVEFRLDDCVVQWLMISFGVIMRRVSRVTMPVGLKRPFLPIGLPLMARRRR